VFEEFEAPSKVPKLPASDHLGNHGITACSKWLETNNPYMETTNPRM
jgi:hypothetical protein